jgi:hypothetical protein
MKFSIVLVAFILNLATYFFFSMKTKSWLNILTPQFLLAMPTIYLFEMIHLHYNGDPGSAVGYLIVYLVYTLPIMGFALGYMYISPIRSLTGIISTSVSTSSFAIAFLMIGLALYAPVMKEFAGDLLNPRAIYTATRSGFGLSYYGSIVACYVFLILALFNISWGWRIKTAAILFSLLFAYLHGSKGQVMTVLFIGMLYFISTSMERVKLWIVALVVTLFGLLGALTFYSMLTDVDVGDLLLVMAGYSDYTRNAVMLIDSSRDFEWGRILFEDNVFSRLPRAIFPDKPKDFGSFALALKYFPDSFYMDAGVPSFGVGVLYADFGLLAIPLTALGGLLSGIAARTAMARLRLYRNPGDFVLLCFLCGIILIPIGSGNLLPEHIVLALLVYVIARRKIRRTGLASSAPMISGYVKD